jgi:hypothetical protein
MRRSASACADFWQDDRAATDMQPVLRRTGLRFATFFAKWWKATDMGPLLPRFCACAEARTLARSRRFLAGSRCCHRHAAAASALRPATFFAKWWKATDTGPSFLFIEPHVGGSCILPAWPLPCSSRFTVNLKKSVPSRKGEISSISHDKVTDMGHAQKCTRILTFGAPNTNIATDMGWSPASGFGKATDRGRLFGGAGKFGKATDRGRLFGSAAKIWKATDRGRLFGSGH